jgi:hypothetical protein
MKRVIPLFLFLIIAFPVISAIEINMNSDIPKGETIIASVSGNFLDPIAKSNIYFYRGHVKTSFDYDVAKIGDNYYIYILTTNKAENNYSINISGVRYMVGSQISNQQISKSFNIINETADFSVNPGFVIANGNFSVKVQDLQSIPITIDIETEVNSGSSDGSFVFLLNREETESIDLLSGEIKTLYIQLENISETTIRTITLSTANTEYKIPCYLILENNTISPENNSNITNYNQTANQTNETNCTFFSKFFGTCSTNNAQNETQENKTFDNDTQKNNTSNNNSSSNSDYEVVKIGNKTVAIKNGTILNESATSKTCAQIKGDICSSGEICQNTTVYAKDAKCCVSQCVKEEKKTNTKLIGWLIIGFLFIVILLFFRTKFRGMKKKRDILLNPKK